MATDDDLRAELRDLVAGFRAALSRRARAGAFAVPSAPSPRPADPSLRPAAPLESADPGAVAGEGGAAGGESARRGAREAVASAGDGGPAPAAARSGEDEAAAGGGRRTLGGIRAELGECARCKLAPHRQNIVFGVGDERAPLMFVGEAPGGEEDRQGEPFVGRAGQLLDRMVAAMGWTRDAVYIANVLKCRPPKNRDPEPDEVEACEPFLAAQIDAIAPRVIVTLGKPAAHLLLRTRAPISALRGRFQEVRGVPVMPTFHPAFLLRSPEKKREAWEDLKTVIYKLSALGVEPPHPPKV